MLIRLSGGLGNQLFQYATGEMIRITMNKRVKYETFAYVRDKKRELQLKRFDIKRMGKTRGLYSLAYYICARIGRECSDVDCWDQRFGILREELSTAVTAEKLRGKHYLVGYWQNVDNLNPIKEELKRQFRCKELFPKSTEVRKVIANSMAVAVHVRRGDYLQGNNAGIYEGCTLQYYKAAMEYMREVLENPIFIVFSNDIGWCKQCFCGKDVLFVDETCSESDINDFCIMKECKHFIIANSTFSWWASWLADDTGKIVIAPTKWFIDEEMNKRVQQSLLRDVIMME